MVNLENAYGDRLELLPSSRQGALFFANPLGTCIKQCLTIYAILFEEQSGISAEIRLTNFDLSHILIVMLN